VRTDFDVTNAT